MSVKEKIMIYIFPFFLGWILFIKHFLIRHPDFIEEYGWLAYQPFTFEVLLFYVMYVNVLKIAKMNIDGKITYKECLKKTVVIGVKFFVLLIIGQLFYVHVLGSKPNLLICF